MQVIYAKTMLQKLGDANLAAVEEQKEIEKIVLTLAEGRKLHSELLSTFAYIGDRQLNDLNTFLLEFECLGHPIVPCPEFRVFGMKIEISR